VTKYEGEIMLNKAIEKIKSEIDVNKNNPYIQAVGELLLQHLQVNPSNAEKIVQEGKNIGQSLAEMRKAAEKKKVGSFAVLTDQEGFGIVLKYFGIESSITNTVCKVNEPKSDAPAIKEKKSEIEFNIELDF
jgi:hypothetical protein